MTPPKTKLYQELIPLEIGDIASLGAAWSALGMEATWSAGELTVVAAAELVGAGTVITALGGVGALIGGVGIAAVMIAAPFVQDEAILHDITEMATEIHPFLSPITQALMGLSSPFMGISPLKDYSDPFALQKLGGSIGDFLAGGLSGTAGERLLSVAGSAAGVPGFLNDFGNVYTYLNQPRPSSSTAASAGGAGTGLSTNPSGGGYSSGTSIYPFSPGLGDTSSYLPGSGPDDSGGMSFNGGGFTTIITAGGTDPEAPGQPTTTIEPPSSEPEPAPAPEPSPEPEPQPEPEPAPEPSPPPYYPPEPDPDSGFFY